MPKRRMTAKRKVQIKRWQLAGSKARKNGIPHGKTLSLYHLTSVDDANSIVKKGFQPQKRRGAYQDKAWFFNSKDAQRALKDAHRDIKEFGKTQYGTSVVKVLVPYKKTKDRRVNRRTGEGVYTVSFNSLKGRKIKRIK